VLLIGLTAGGVQFELNELEGVAHELTVNQIPVPLFLCELCFYIKVYTV